MATKINIKNYTSQVPVETSVSKIERMLVNAGGNNILKGYDQDRELESLQFSLIINGNSVLFKVKAYRTVISDLLISEYKKPTDRSYELVAEQSGRTAWKIIHDWVEVQLTMVKLEQMEMAEAFMTKWLNPSTGKTFFDVVKHDGFKMLGA
jgi:hypothetical protein